MCIKIFRFTDLYNSIEEVYFLNVKKQILYSAVDTGKCCNFRQMGRMSSIIYIYPEPLSVTAIILARKLFTL